MAKQLLRSGTSVGANYRTAQRARSRREFDARLGIVEEECDESLFWMELSVEAGLARAGKVDQLRREGDEILSIIVAARKSISKRA